MSPYELIVDSFAGGGGASLGIYQALNRHPDIAINHDKEAIALHAANHPESRHYAEDVWKVEPREACGSRPVGLMWLSPDCKHFSKAKGGKPVSKKVRGLAWVAIRWAKAVKPRVIVLENVEEFQTWGPVLRDTNKPCQQRKGQTFRAFCRRLRALGYEVQHRQLRACDYGAPTIRRRLFLIARCDGKPIVWPNPTHGKHTPNPWRTAAECIQWEIPCPSIFERKKPLADNTLRRIARGLDRFVLNNPRPFIVPVSHAGDSRVHDIEEPLRTITGSSRSTHALVAPTFIVNMANGGNLEDIQKPVTTIMTERGGCRALVAPTLIQTGYGEDQHRNGGLGQPPRSLDLHQPLGTVVGGGVKHALVSAFIAKHNAGHEATGQLPLDPMHTLTAQDTKALVTSNLIHLRGTEESHLHGDGMDAPMRVVSASGLHAAEVRAFLCAYYGNEKDGGQLDIPMRTVTSKDRFGLVTVQGHEYFIADIGMRMLVPRELYRAQGFPDSYRIDIPFNGKPLTKTAQVRMVGNSVCPPLAKAIVAANVGDEAEEVRAA